jgi:hypothetical protein
MSRKAAGFVEEQGAWLLGQRHREQDALALACREVENVALRELARADPRQGVEGDLAVALGLEGETGEMRMASEEDDLQNPKRHRERGSCSTNASWRASSRGRSARTSRPPTRAEPR